MVSSSSHRRAVPTSKRTCLRIGTRPLDWSRCLQTTHPNATSYPGKDARRPANDQFHSAQHSLLRRGARTRLFLLTQTSLSEQCQVSAVVQNCFHSQL